MTALLDAYKRLPLKLVRGAGSWVDDDAGRTYLDFYGGHAVAATGHCHPRLVAALQEQVQKLLFYSNAVHVEHQEEAAALIVEALPPPLSKVFFVNSGAEAVENVLKLARLATGRTQVVAFTGGFHGRTLGALAATGLPKYRASAGLAIGEHAFAPFGDAGAVKTLLASGDVAAVILEPVQSLAGVRTADAGFFRELRRLCDDAGALLIYDELQTGTGRTGTFAYAGRHGVVPDLLTLGKGLGSGVPVAAVVAAESVAARVKPGDVGTTFGGGPLACLAVKTTLEVLRDENLPALVASGSARLRQALAAFDDVKSVRGEGYLLGVELPEPAAPLQQALLSAGVLTGLCDDPCVLRLMPPLTTTAGEIEHFLVKFALALEQTHDH